MKSLLGTVVIENIGGGGGEIGTVAVSRAAPDGYTVLLANSSVLVINPLARTVPSYDPVNSFDTVAIVGHGAQAIAVNARRSFFMSALTADVGCQAGARYPANRSSLTYGGDRAATVAVPHNAGLGF